MQPRISFVLCAFNGEKYIWPQVTSILNIIGPDDELLIIDDCSTDATVDIVEKMSDHRLVLRQNSSNIGYAANFMSGIALAKNDIIFLADQDDIHSPFALDRALSYLLQGYSLYVGSILIGDSKMIPVSFLGNQSDISIKHLSVIKRGYYLIKLLLGRQPAFGCAMAINRKDFSELLNVPFEQGSPPHDLMLLAFALANKLPVAISSTAHLIHRIHRNNTSPLASTRTLSTKIRQRLRMLGFLYPMLGFLKCIENRQ